MSSDTPRSSDDERSQPSASHPHALAKIQPAQQLRFMPEPVGTSAELARVRTLQIGGAILIGTLGVLAWPFGQRLVRFVFIAGIIFLIIGLLSARTNVLLRNHFARKRARKLGELTFVQGTLTLPTHQGPEQFNLRDPHTQLREWKRVYLGTESQTITSLLIAQDGVKAVIFSDEPSSSEEARDFGFLPDDNTDLAHLPPEQRVRVPLAGLQALTRMIDEDQRKLAEAAR